MEIRLCRIVQSVGGRSNEKKREETKQTGGGGTHSSKTTNVSLPFSRANPIAMSSRFLSSTASTSTIQFNYYLINKLIN